MKGYLLRLTAAAILSSIIGQLAPKGSSGRGARLAAGLLILAVAFSPLGQVNTLDAAEDLMKQVKADPLQTDFLAKSNRELMSSLISSEAEAYILDKANALGLSPEVTVTVSVRENYPVPWSVILEGQRTPAQETALSTIIAKDLDIPEERQEWMTKESG